MQLGALISPITKSSDYFTSFDGTKIYYEVRGEGKPLVFVYGIACLINHWHPQLSYFSKGYQTIIFDYRGHHFSDIPEDKGNLSLDAIAQDVLTLCDHLKISRASFLGHSFGCEVLLKAYLLRPELFESVCFTSGFFNNPFEKFASAAQLREIFINARKIYNAAPSVVSTLWRLGVTNPLSVYLSALVGGFNLKQTAIKDIEIYANGVANIDVRVFLTLFEQLIDYDGNNDLAKILCPTLIIAGDKDTLTPPNVQKLIHVSIDNSELHVISKGSHCLQLDFPDLVNEKISHFLKKINY